MGSCASIHKSSEPAMKLGVSFGSESEKVDNIPQSPVKQTIKDLALSASSKNFGPYGSKDEAFFDSHPWLESDCEDDFYSVNGDFTPSRGNTPVNQGHFRANKTPFESRLPPNIPAPTTPSPTEKKKRLLELFKESIRDDINHYEDESKGTTSASSETNGTTVGSTSTPFLSGSSSERTPNGDDNKISEDYEKPMRMRPCCLPSLITCRSFTERKKKLSSAATNIAAVSDRA